MARILIVDSDARFRQILIGLLQARGHEVAPMNEASTEVLDLLAKYQFDVAIYDVALGETSGLELLEASQIQRPELPVIMVTASGSVDSALQSLKLGAFDYVTKPFKVNEFMLVLDRALKQKSREPGSNASKKIPYGAGQIVAASNAMKQACKLISQIAPSDVPILLQGENGTGKTFFAQTIHNVSRRKDKSFVVVDCSSRDEQELNIELFGYVRGAFPDANDDKRGTFVSAHGGTVVLNEVGGLPPGIQNKLLTLLKDKKLQPLGVETDATCDVRIIATTSSDLKPLVERGAFSLELHTRLKAISIEIPALKDRREDVIPLTRHFLKSMSSEETDYTIAPDARGVLLHYNWPGNTRELHDLVQSLLSTLSGNLITGKDLPQNLLDALGGRKMPTLQVDTASGRGVAAAEFIRSQSGTLTNGTAVKENA